jgi:hypothetical protein
LELDYPYLYACASGKGLYRANVTVTARGWKYLGLASSTFPNIHGGTVRNALVLDNNTILAATCYYPEGEADYPPGLHRSEDNGGTWIRSDYGIDQDNGDFCCPGPITHCDHHVFAGSYGCGIFRSEDRGIHWERSGGQLGWWYGPEWLELSPADCGVIWQAGQTAFEEYRLAVSTDHGASWKWIEAGSGIQGVVALTPDPVDANTAYCGMHRSIMKTHDLGSSFEPILELPEHAVTRALSCGQSSGHVFVAFSLFEADTTQNFIYEIRDGIAAVDTLAIPITGSVLYMLNDNERKTIYAAGQGGVYQYVY